MQSLVEYSCPWKHLEVACNGCPSIRSSYTSCALRLPWVVYDTRLTKHARWLGAGEGVSEFGDCEYCLVATEGNPFGAFRTDVTNLLEDV